MVVRASHAGKKARMGTRPALDLTGKNRNASNGGRGEIGWRRLECRVGGTDRAGLFQRTIDRRELGIELGAQPVHGNDNSERDTRRDQAILDGCRAGLVSKEGSESSHRVYKPPKLLNPV